jgi:hypothetical protein
VRAARFTACTLALTSLLILVGSRPEEQYTYKKKGVKAEKGTAVPAADATPAGVGVSVTTPASQVFVTELGAASLVGAMERGAASALMGLEQVPLTATSPLRPVALPRLLMLTSTPADATPAADAFATPEPRVNALPLQQAEPPRPDVRAEAALETARCTFATCEAELADAAQRQATAEAMLEAAMRMPAVEAREKCLVVAATCKLVAQMLSVVVATASLAMDRLDGDSWKVARDLHSKMVPEAQAQVAALACRAAAGVEKANAALARYDPARHEAGVLDLSYAHFVLDDMVDGFVRMETAWQGLPKADKPQHKKQRRETLQSLVSAMRAAMSAMHSIEDDKITGFRRMLHLKRVAASAGSPTYWRGLSERDELLLEAVLPIADANANAVFTRVVDHALEAHKSKHKTAPAAATYEVALMWTDPLAVTLRQLAHLDAVFGQSISVTALSRLIDAFIALDGAPEFTSDQLLRGLGLTKADVVWAEQHMLHLITKAKEYGVLPIPELCEPFMDDVVLPGASRCRAVAMSRCAHAPT